MSKFNHIINICNLTVSVSEMTQNLSFNGQTSSHNASFQLRKLQKNNWN